MKRGVKLLFAALSVFGAGFVTACNTMNNNNQPPVVENVPTENTSTSTNTNTDTKTDTGTKTETNTNTETENNNGENTESTTETSGNNEQQKVDYQDLIDKINLEAQIQSYLDEKLNDRFGENLVEEVDAKYFVVSDTYLYGKMLSVYGDVKMYSNADYEPVVLNMELSDIDFDILDDANLNNYQSQTAELHENYTIDQLECANYVISNDALTYSSAYKNNEVWDLDVMTASKLEELIENKYTTEISNYFVETFNNHSFSKADIKYINLFKVSQTYELELCGEGKLVNNNTKRLKVYVNISENSYNNLKNILDTNYDANNELAHNYSKEQLNYVYQVLNNDSSRTLGFELNYIPYTINTNNMTM